MYSCRRPNEAVDRFVIGRSLQNAHDCVSSGTMTRQAYRSPSPSQPCPAPLASQMRTSRPIVPPTVHPGVASRGCRRRSHRAGPQRTRRGWHGEIRQRSGRRIRHCSRCRIELDALSPASCTRCRESCHPTDCAPRLRFGHGYDRRHGRHVPHLGWGRRDRSQARAACLGVHVDHLETRGLGYPEGRANRRSPRSQKRPACRTKRRTMIGDEREIPNGAGTGLCHADHGPQNQTEDPTPSIHLTSIPGNLDL